ncbi:MAG TPA: ABC transporter permease [Vicinamibacterales bacterium]|nr:ABC transporter permease [Vicinamibacterales bacterium]
MTPAPRRPPAPLRRLASALLPRDDRELLLGDLEDAYAARCARAPRAVAAAIFIAEAAHAAIGRRRRPVTVLPPPHKGAHMFDSLARDLRYGARGLARNPGFTAVALLSLALGIGFNTAVFTVVNGILLRPLPVADPDRLVTIYTSEKDGYRYATASLPDYHDLRERTTTLGGLSGHSLMFASLERDGVASLALGELVTANYFDVIGVPLARGAGFTPADDRAGAPPAMIISDAFWKRELGSAPDAIGRTVRIRGKACTIVGIAPPTFHGLMPGMIADLWLPASMAEDVEPVGYNASTGTTGTTRFDRRGQRWMFLKGRLQPGATVEQAGAELSSIMAALAADFPGTNEGVGITVLRADQVRLHPELDGMLTPLAALLVAAVGLVLLVACANIANMLLARGAARSREMAVRAAIGAGRGRLARQLLAENLLLALGGGALGTLLAAWAVSLPLPLPLPLALDVAIDARVLLFAFAVSLTTGLVFGLVPALQASRPSLVPALKGDAPGGRASRRLSLRSLLVVTQVAVSTVLVVSAALLVRSVAAARVIDVGFEQRGLAYATFAPTMIGYEDEAGLRFFREAADRLRAAPGITDAALAERLPFSINYQFSEFFIEGRPDLSGKHGLSLDVTRVDRHYFDTMGIRLIEGRNFSERDTPDSPLVAVINETMARRYFPGESAVGKRLRARTPSGPVVDIIGVSAAHPVRSVGEPPRPFIHLSLDQRRTGGNSLVIRGSLPDDQLATTLRREILALDPRMFFLELQPYAAQIETTLFPVRAGAMLLGMVGALALGLAAIGLYGVLAFNVSRRTREIGIRMALGARPESVLGLILRDALTLVAAGIVAGLAAAWTTSGALGSVLVGVAPRDPLAYGLAVVVLLGVATIAALIPARRAARLDPLAALRHA